ncbi:MAG: hypothetical protein KBA03_01335 [Anaerolineaceae bacterium]|nr:hypothetical protein [Anaerolineaceae bacterium]
MDQEINEEKEVPEEVEATIAVENTNEALPVENPTPVEPKKRSNMWMVLAVVLLVGIFALNLSQYLTERADRNSRAEQIESAQNIYQESQELLDSMLDSYNEAVYQDPDVTNINHQQLRAIEYNFLTLNMIARQNQQIILLLNTLP